MEVRWDACILVCLSVVHVFCFFVKNRRVWSVVCSGSGFRLMGFVAFLSLVLLVGLRFCSLWMFPLGLGLCLVLIKIDGKKKVI